MRFEVLQKVAIALSQERSLAILLKRIVDELGDAEASRWRGCGWSGRLRSVKSAALTPTRAMLHIPSICRQVWDARSHVARTGPGSMATFITAGQRSGRSVTEASQP